MTTIAASRQEMASDSLTTWSNLVFSYNSDRPKVQRANGHLVGFCGRTDSGILFVDWLRAGADPEKRPELAEGFEALTLDESGQLAVWDDACVAVSTDRDYLAIGSGRELAIGAMAMGATPAEAVEVACEWDTGSAGPVSVERLEET